MKSIWTSKTVWLNCLLTAAGIVALLQTQQFSPKTLEWLVIAAGILNVINRVWFTSEPIA